MSTVCNRRFSQLEYVFKTDTDRLCIDSAHCYTTQKEYRYEYFAIIEEEETEKLTKPNRVTSHDVHTDSSGVMAASAPSCGSLSAAVSF